MPRKTIVDLKQEIDAILKNSCSLSIAEIQQMSSKADDVNLDVAESAGDASATRRSSISSNSSSSSQSSDGLKLPIKITEENIGIARQVAAEKSIKDLLKSYLQIKSAMDKHDNTASIFAEKIAKYLTQRYAGLTGEEQQRRWHDIKKILFACRYAKGHNELHASMNSILENMTTGPVWLQNTFFSKLGSSSLKTLTNEALRLSDTKERQIQNKDNLINHLIYTLGDSSASLLETIMQLDVSGYFNLKIATSNTDNLRDIVAKAIVDNLKTLQAQDLVGTSQKIFFKDLIEIAANKGQDALINTIRSRNDVSMNLRGTILPSESMRNLQCNVVNQILNEIMSQNNSYQYRS